MKKMVNVYVDNASTISDVPTDEQFHTWASLAAAQHNRQGDINLRLVNSAEIQALNQQFRHKDKPTNVLSFPFEPFDNIEVEQLIIGDIALCPAIILQEAKEQNKTSLAHWAHMCIHSVLHLLGYDHIQDTEAHEMEQLEITLLQQLGYENPYE